MFYRKILLSLSLTILLTGCWELERGQKVGQILSINKAGFFIKTWTCKLIRGGMDDGSGAFGQSIWINIEDETLLPALQKAMIDRTFITLNYHGELIATFRSNSEDNLFLDSIVEK